MNNPTGHHRGEDTRPSSFLLVPWAENFLEPLLEQALEDCRGDLGKAVFIFPHSRPQRYLQRLIRANPRIPRPVLLPECYAVRELFSVLCRSLLSRPAWNAGLLDRMGLLLECARAQCRDDALFSLSREGGGRDALRFFPWGVRLAALFEECLIQGRTPEDIQYAEGQVPPFAAMLLSRLSGIFAGYTEALAARDWTTPGFNAFRTARAITEGNGLPESFFAGRQVIIAGFHLLTGTEEILFRHLWERAGARVVLHADPRLLTGNAHWSCDALARWVAGWRATARLCPGTGASLSLWEEAQPGGFRHQGIRYYQGYDLHSQLAVLESELAACSAPGAEEEGGEAAGHDAPLAVILPDSGLLMPCLHHMPHTDINVSMGYPLVRSPLFRLLDIIFRMQESRRGKGYYWRDLIELLRHPYVKMLSPAVDGAGSPPAGQKAALATGEDASLRGELRRLEQVVRRSGMRYPEPEQMLETALAELNPEERPERSVWDLLTAVINATMTAFEDLFSPRSMGTALQGVCGLLTERGVSLWDRFLIDAECLYRLTESVIPELTRSAAADEPFTPAGLFSLTRQLLEAERVPFEADPLVGTQVMGVLESRLLTFKRVFLPDATEDRLPGTPAGDPLLPDALRPLLGLPPAHSREQTTAYHFFRLLAGADDVCLLWQEGGRAPGEGQGGKKKSRFVEELLWEEEKRRQCLFHGKGGQGPLHVLETGLTPLLRTHRSLPQTPATRALLEELLSRPLSASFFDAYLRCPFRFAVERLLRLVPPDEVSEGDDPLALGRVFHEALQNYFTPLLGRALPATAALSSEEKRERLAELMACLEALPEYGRLRAELPADSASMLSQAARIRLARFLERQPATTVAWLETTLNAVLPTNSGPLKLTGRLDRLDMRPMTLRDNDNHAEFPLHETRILDYKTGRLPEADPAFWDDEPLWKALETWTPGGPGDEELFTAVTARMESVQLPLYLLLFSQADAFQAGPDVTTLPEAAWVDLADSGGEIPLFGQECSGEERRFIIHTRVPALVNFLVRHMRETPRFFPRPGPYCRWCSAEKMCISESVFK